MLTWKDTRNHSPNSQCYVVATIPIRTSPIMKLNCLSALSELYTTTHHLKSTFLFLFKHNIVNSVKVQISCRFLPWHFCYNFITSYAFTERPSPAFVSHIVFSLDELRIDHHDKLNYRNMITLLELLITQWQQEPSITVTMELRTTEYTVHKYKKPHKVRTTDRTNYDIPGNLHLS